MKRILLFFTFLISCFTGFSQAINVSTTAFTVPQLVREKLFSLQPGQNGNACTGSISNITWSTGTNFGQANGIGYFTNTNPNFPLTSGVVLTTGSAAATPGPNIGTLSGGVWPGDTQLFNYIQALGIDPTLSGYNDATIIEFDFVPLTNTMSFDFLFASDEYGFYQCQFADAFAFFLTNTTLGTPPVNLAVVPNTTTPISVLTIRNNANNTGCASANAQYFGNYYPPSPDNTVPTNFNGNTVVMTAQSAVIPNNTYHIKLVVADRNDSAFDSAVFLGAGSFNFPIQTNGFGSTGFTVADQTAICSGKTRVVTAQLSPTPGAIYTWSLNGNPIPNSNNNNYTISQPGTYQVVIQNPNGTQSSSCPFLVEYYPPLPIANPNDLSQPASNPIFNLTSNTSVILNGASSFDYDISYHLNLPDAQNVANAITNPAAYTALSNGQIIYVAIRDLASGNSCDETRSFILNLSVDAGADGSTTVCDSSSTTIDLFSLITGEDTGGVWTQTTGSGGVFNASAGTYTPAPGASNSVFTYTVSAASAPISSDTSTATININPQPNAGSDGSTVVCELSTTSIDLFSLIAGEQSGGVWTQVSGTGGTFDPIAGTYIPAVAATTSVFQYELSATAPCVNDISTATITINAQPIAGTDGSTTICETSSASIDLFSLITGEQVGGVWTRTLGTGGTFNAAAGTFTPAIGATSSTFIYTLTGTAPCNNVTSSAQVIINAQPNAGTDGATNVCESSTDVINLFTLITGEQTGGVWTQTAGSGGTFNAAAGTFTPGFGATTSTFRYTLTGTAPCVDGFSEVTITFVTAPIITQPTPFVVCDDSLNNDGIYCFDLSTKDAEITTAPGVVVTYHLTATDALIGANPLPNPYCNNDPSFQTIYPRVFDPLAPQCPSTTTLDLVINPLPIPNPTISDYVLCDVNNSPDGFEQFDLSTKNLEIANGLTGVTINYYLTQPLAVTNDTTTALPTTYTNTTANAQVIWFNISYTATGCNTTGSFNLIVNPLPLSTQPGYPQYELCDYDQTQLGQEEFDLGTQITGILLGQNGMDVAFYPSLNDATNDTNEITNLLYTNVQPYAQTLGIRITNILTGCYVTSTLDLVVNPLPTLVPPTQAYIVCGTSQNGQAEFDLNTLTAGIQGTGNYNISYHLTPEDAASGFNPIDLTMPYQNNSTIQFLYVRGEDTNGNGCFSVIQIELNVNPSPIVPLTLPDLVECDDDNNTQNGITAFDLEQQTPVILAAQTPPSSNYTVTYYTTLNDANLQQNSIVQTGTYPGTNGQTIWYVVENTPTTCAAVGSFQLVVNTPIVLTTPTLYKVCDNDANPNDLYTTFDLVSFIGTIPGHTVTFYTNNSYTTLITTPDAFVNTIAANQTIGVLVTNNTTGCISRSTLTLSVLRVPTPRTDPPALPAQCDNNNPGDGFEVFNLTANAAYIMNNDNSVTLHYYPSYQDAIDDTNEIGLPQAASVNGNVWIRVESNNSIDSANEHCYILVEQALTVNPLPTVNAAISDYQICDNGSTPPPTFDLTTKIVEILGTTQLPADYTVSFYTSQAEAQSGSNPITTPTAYANTSNPQIIYVRVVNNTTGCVNATGQFTILINPKPTATAPADFATCDSDGTNDGFYAYPLDVLAAGVLGTQDPNDFTVTFYDTFTDADAGTNAIIDTVGYLAYTHTVWVRVTNNVTGCYELTSFDVIVEQLPEPNITSSTGFNVLCVDYVTNIPASPLVLTANNTIPGTFTYQWFEGTTLLVGETNATYSVNTSAVAGATRTYTVVMTSASGATTPACDASDSFDVIQSGQASIVGPTGYTVTNAFTNNQIITVTVEGYGQYEYSLDNGPRQISEIFTNVSLGNHTITVWDVENPGFSCDPLEILNVQTIDYPHYFTPNGDGIHDTWNIEGLSGQPNAKIYIFDRYGKLLKQISAAGAGWDGTYNGQMLPATDYWFTVEYLEQTVKEFKAHFSLKR